MALSEPKPSLSQPDEPENVPNEDDLPAAKESPPHDARWNKLKRSLRMIKA
jgi:hypothetical protein